VERDVARDRSAAMEMIRRSGQQGVPVIAAGDEVIVGFDQPRLARLADRFAAPTRPPLGVLGADAAKYLAQHPELAASLPPGTTGVYAGRVRAGTVADRAGLVAGDVITGLAGKRVPTMAVLDQLIGTVGAGDAVTVRFLRAGEERTATLQF
jgi:S1-C subfamily serine protease